MCSTIISPKQSGIVIIECTGDIENYRLPNGIVLIGVYLSISLSR